MKFSDKWKPVYFRDGDLLLNNKSISDIHQIKEYEGYKKAKFIDLSNNTLKEISGLKELEIKNLIDLNLEGNNITKINGLQDCSNLKTLGFGEDFDAFWDTGEKNLFDLHSYKGRPLRELGAGNQIKEICGLEELVNLEHLTLSFNQITEIKGLDTLKNLTQLDLSFNYITKIEGLDKLKNLTWLNLMFNNISEINGLEKLSNLKALYLGHNQISELKGIRKLNNLVFLLISMNKITEIKKTELPSRLLDEYFPEHLENENIKLI